MPEPELKFKSAWKNGKQKSGWQKIILWKIFYLCDLFGELSLCFLCVICAFRYPFPFPQFPQFSQLRLLWGRAQSRLTINWINRIKSASIQAKVVQVWQMYFVQFIFKFIEMNGNEWIQVDSLQRFAQLWLIFDAALGKLSVTTQPWN